MKICKFFCTVLFCFTAFTSYAAELTLSLDKTTITEADTVFLTIEYTGDSDKKPDLSSLQDNFRIVSNSSSQQINFINGNLSQSKKWTLGLQPLKQGKITIAPLRMGNLISNSVEVEVKEVTNVAYVPDSQENSNSPYFQIEQTFDVKEPYVQQQTTLFVTIYDSIGLQDGGIFIDEESKKDWIIIPLVEKPIVRQDVINHKKMNLETYVFAVFPQKSGNIKEPSFSFDGYYVKNSGFDFPNFNDDINLFGVNFHNVFGQRVPVKMKTKSKTINVRPIPNNYSGKFWLPLNSLKMESSWNIKKGFMVGEAVTRTITIKAEGMTESMLPQISFADADGFKQYPEKPEVTEQVDKGIIVTTAQINNVYIPSKSGNLTIPEIRLDWFNINTNKKETAVIAKEEVMVLPNPMLEPQPAVNEEKESLPQPQPPTASEEKAQTVEPIEVKDNSFAFVVDFVKQFYVAILVAVLLFFALLWLIISQKKKHFYRNAVIKNIRRHDYKKAKESILLWAKFKFYPTDINNFNDIALVAKNDDFAKCLSELNRVLYADGVEFFDNAKFIEILKKVDRMKTSVVKNVETLPKLYE